MDLVLYFHSMSQFWWISSQQVSFKPRGDWGKVTHYHLCFSFQSRRHQVIWLEWQIKVRSRKAFSRDDRWVPNGSFPPDIHGRQCDLVIDDVSFYVLRLYWVWMLIWLNESWLLLEKFQILVGRSPFLGLEWVLFKTHMFRMGLWRGSKGCWQDGISSTHQMEIDLL